VAQERLTISDWKKAIVMLGSKETWTLPLLQSLSAFVLFAISVHGMPLQGAVSEKGIKGESQEPSKSESEPEIGQGNSMPIADEEILDIMLSLQGAARSGSLEGLRSILDEDSLKRLVAPNVPGYDILQILRTFEFIQHPARFVTIIRLGDSAFYEEMKCRQIILPRDAGRYRYLDGPIPEPFGFKQVDFWACFHRDEGPLKVFLGYPLQDLVCLMQ
jgi:hypothetical protein